jgi:hypothetical protein
LTPDVARKLLASIDADRLVLVCGAGLSIPAPSNLPSAAQVSRHCYDKHAAIETLPADMREDLGKLAQHFYTKHQLPGFIDGLVPWERFNGPPNRGHAAVADLLICRALSASLSANFDDMVERWARQFRFDFRAALDGTGALKTADLHSPFLKFHGCMTLARQQTVWAEGQLQGDPQVRANVQSCREWMKMKLSGKDLVFIGFWSDWTYLNEIFAAALQNADPNLVILVDKGDPTWLETKAPDLWNIANGGTAIEFHHLALSSEQFLDALRLEFSRAWFRRFLMLGAAAFEAAKGTKCAPGLMDPPASFGVAEFYDFRRDAEGVPLTGAARTRQPPANGEATALAHLLLRTAGASPGGSWWNLRGSAVRVVNGAGRQLEAVKTEFEEPAAVTQPEYVIAAGAYSLGVPAHLVRKGTPGSIVRSTPAAEWITLETALADLHL